MSGGGGLSADGALRIVCQDDKAPYCHLVPKSAFADWTSRSYVLDRQIVVYICLLELLIGLLAAVGAWLIKPVCLDRKSVAVSLLTSTTVSAFYTLVIPLQTFLGNRVDYPFALSSVLGSDLLVFGGCWAACFLLLLLTLRSGGYLIHLFLLSLVVYHYFATGIFAAFAPQLNGTTTYYMSKPMKLLDTGLLLGFMVVFSAAYKWLRQGVVWICLAVAVLSAASLCDVKKPVEHTDCDESYRGCLVTKDKAKEELFLSAKRNVIMVVVYACPPEVVNDVLTHSPELAKKFDGFVSFENNIGMHPYTLFALVGYVSGKYHRGTGFSLGPQEFKDECFGTNTIFHHYHNLNVPAVFIPSYFANAYCFRPGVEYGHEDSEQTAADVSPFVTRPADPLALTLFELIRFRLTPFMFKCRQLNGIYAGASLSGEGESESLYYPRMMQLPVRTDMENNLIVLHTRGGHMPFVVDRDGQDVPAASTGYEHYYDQVYYVLSQVGKFLDSLREKKVLDGASIIVAADHGQIARITAETKQESLPINAHAMLMVKPKGAVAPFTVDKTTPTAHARMAELLKSLANHDGTIEEIRSILRQDVRVFVFPADGTGEVFHQKKGYLEWHVDAAGASTLVHQGE